MLTLVQCSRLYNAHACAMLTLVQCSRLRNAHACITREVSEKSEKFYPKKYFYSTTKTEIIFRSNPTQNLFPPPPHN